MNELAFWKCRTKNKWKPKNTVNYGEHTFLSHQLYKNGGGRSKPTKNFNRSYNTNGGLKMRHADTSHFFQRCIKWVCEGTHEYLFWRCGVQNILTAIQYKSNVFK